MVCSGSDVVMATVESRVRDSSGSVKVLVRVKAEPSEVKKQPRDGKEIPAAIQAGASGKTSKNPNEFGGKRKFAVSIAVQAKGARRNASRASPNPCGLTLYFSLAGPASGRLRREAAA